MGINRIMSKEPKTTFQRIKFICEEEGIDVPDTVIAHIMSIVFDEVEKVHVPETLTRMADGSWRPIQTDMFDES
jgi:ABC-type branched-subunit amino acid transport system ATPase component